MSFKCPNCNKMAHVRSSRAIGEHTERYNQCQNIECGTIFITLEQLIRVTNKPVEKVQAK